MIICQERGECCSKHWNIHRFLSSSTSRSGTSVSISMSKQSFPYIFQNPEYLRNYWSILTFSQDPVDTLKVLFGKTSLIKQKDKHLSKWGYLHLFATTYENEPGKLGISYYQQHDSHKFCHKVLLSMSFGNQTIFWNLITVGLNALLWLAGKNNIAWSNTLKNKMQNSYDHVISK